MVLICHLIVTNNNSCYGYFIKYMHFLYIMQVLVSLLELAVLLSQS